MIYTKIILKTGLAAVFFMFVGQLQIFTIIPVL